VRTTLACVALLLGCGGRSGDQGGGSADKPTRNTSTGAPLAPSGPGRPELGGVFVAARWSALGRHVVFDLARSPGAGGSDRDVIVVDAASHAALSLAGVRELAFAPDDRHLVVRRGDELVVHDLETGTRKGAPATIESAISFAPDDRLGWIERAGDEYRVRLRELATDAETVLTGLPLSGESAPELFYDGEHVVALAGQGGAIRIWKRGGGAPIAGHDRVESVVVADGGVVYATSDARDRWQLRHLSFAQSPPRPTELRRDQKCGAGELQRHGRATRCASHRYLVLGRRALCVWDTSRGRVQSHIAIRDPGDHGCTEEIVYVGEDGVPPGGPYRFYSLATGRPAREPRDFIPESLSEPELDHEAPRPPVPSGATAIVVSRRSGMVAGVLDGRATLWSAAGEQRWQSPAPSTAAALAFHGAGELVVAGRDGELWRVELATRKLRATTLADCVLATAWLHSEAPIAIASDGRVAAACLRDNARTLLLDGADAPVFASSAHGWHVTAAMSATHATIGWRDHDGARAWSLPDGKLHWHHEVPSYGLAITADGQRLAAAAAAGDPRLPSTRFVVSIRDAKNRELATATLAAEPIHLAFSPDGELLAATLRSDQIAIVDATSGKVIDELEARATRGLAWAPSGKRRIAYWGSDPRVISIRDVADRRDADRRELPATARGSIGSIHAIAWGPDGTLAAIADRQVVLWEPSGQPTVLAFFAGGGVELRADDTARLLGDAAAARELLGCRVEKLVHPVSRCTGKLVRD
jgi:WD40 repeat protein